MTLSEADIPDGTVDDLYLALRAREKVITPDISTPNLDKHEAGWLGRIARWGNRQVDDHPVVAATVGGTALFAAGGGFSAVLAHHRH